MKDKETPYVPGILDTYVGMGKVGERAHILYKYGHKRDVYQLPIKEFLFADGTLISGSVEMEYCGYDSSVDSLLSKGFIYLGIGVLHK
jgi:hypothetical protein